jgi:hypothetical protein
MTAWKVETCCHKKSLITTPCYQGVIQVVFDGNFNHFMENVCQFGEDKIFEIREGFSPYELILCVSCKKTQSSRYQDLSVLTQRLALQITVHDTKICLY